MDPISKAEAKTNMGNTYLGLRQYANAVQCYSKAIEICPKIAKYYARRSECYIKMEDFVKGLVDAKKCIEYDPLHVKGYLQVVECSLSSGDVKFADKTIKTALDNLPQNKDILNSAEKVKVLQRLEAEYTTNLAKKLYEKALENVEKCLEKSPSCLGYMVKKADCLILLERFTEADALADAILKIKPTNEDALCIKVKAQLYSKNDIDDESMCTIRDLKRKQPDHLKTAQVFRNSTMIQTAQKDVDIAVARCEYEKAYELLTKAIKVDEHYKYKIRKLYLRKFAIVPKEKKLLWPGAKDCTDYLAIFEKDVGVMKKRAQFYMDLEEYDLAMEDYKIILTFEDFPANRLKLQEATDKFEAQTKQPHKILKLPARHTKDDVQKAFKDLIIHYHPDRQGVVTPEYKKFLENKVIRARNAMESILRNMKFK